MWFTIIDKRVRDSAKWGEAVAGVSISSKGVFLIHCQCKLPDLDLPFVGRYSIYQRFRSTCALGLRNDIHPKDFKAVSRGGCCVLKGCNPAD